MPDQTASRDHITEPEPELLTIIEAAQLLNRPGESGDSSP